MGKIKEYIVENEYLMKYIKDKKLAEQLGSGSDKKIEWICPNCNEVILKTPSEIKRRGFKCKVCNDSRPYSERLMEQILLDNNIEFESQKKFEKCKYKDKLPFDFYLPEYNMCVEMQGEQHYNVHINSVWYKETMNHTDRIKEEFCLKNDIEYVAINCSKSDMDFIIKHIKQSKLKDIIRNYDKHSLKESLMKRNHNFDIDYIIEQHEKGKSFLKISKETGVDRKKIVQILKKLGKYTPRGGKKNNSRKVVRVNDGKIFNSIKEAIDEVNLKQENNIMLVCQGKRKYAGKNPITGEKYQWKYYEDYFFN